MALLDGVLDRVVDAALLAGLGVWALRGRVSPGLLVALTVAATARLPPPFVVRLKGLRAGGWIRLSGEEPGRRVTSDGASANITLSGQVRSCSPVRSVPAAPPGRACRAAA